MRKVGRKVNGLKRRDCISKKGMYFNEVPYEEIQEDLYTPLEISIGKFKRNMKLFWEIIMREEYRDLCFIQVAYLDSVNWDFDKKVIDTKLLSGLNDICKTKKDFMKYLQNPAINWESRLERKRKIMKNFRIAEKEYLDSLGPKEPEPVEFPNERFCSEGCEHQFIGINGKRTCCKCGLEVGPTHYVSEYGCWDRAIMRHKPATIREKVYGFVKRKGVSGYELFGKVSPGVINRIINICDKEEPKGKRLPNLNIISYQVCKLLGVEVNESLLKIPKGKVPHDRCRKLFQKIGLEYVE